ncbi:hypothetical protein YC2023_097805 [Brassica napus]
MDHIYRQWLKRFSFKNATIALTIVNVLIFLFLLRGLFTSSSSSSSSSSRRIISGLLRSFPGFQIKVAHLVLALFPQLRYIKEAREIRLAMQPLELIKRVKEIQQEASAGHETDVKQNTEAVDLSKRLKAFLPTNEESSLKALEEWRKRKMERARQRDLEKTGGKNCEHKETNKPRFESNFHLR